MNWFRRLLSFQPPAPVPASAVVAHSSESAHVPAAPPVAGKPRPSSASKAHAVVAAPQRPLSESDVAFLDGLMAPPELKALDDFCKTDQVFLAGISKRLRMRHLDLPVLPDVAIRLTEMLRNDRLPIADYVALLNRDPLLGVEVLQVANSPAYATAPTSSLREAVMRIGLTRLQSILMVSHLKARILKGSAAQRQAGLLLDLGLAIGLAASKLLPNQQAADMRYVRGVLMHIEHMVVLGVIGDVSRERHDLITPSVTALHQAFDRYGPPIRELLTSAWKLDEMLSPGGDGASVDLYPAVRRLVLSRWLIQPRPDVPGVPPAMAEAVASQIEARIARPRDDERAAS